MKPFRAIYALLLPLAGAAAAVPAAAQQPEASVLPRGLLEVSAGGRYTHYDRRLGSGGAPLGAEFLPAYQEAVERGLAVPAGAARMGVASVLATLPGEGPDDLADSLTTGRAALGLAADVRQAPFSLRYGLTSRVTLSADIALERRGTAVTALYLAAANLGINPAPDSNRAALERINPSFADFGAGLLLPVAGSPAAKELQARLRSAGEGDTLRLPQFPVRIADILSREELAANLSPEEQAALGLSSGRREYALGDLRLGASLLVRRGPAGWPYPEAGGRGLRTVLGVHGRIPTGRSGVTFLTEIPSGAGHAGVGVELLNDLFLGSRWSVHAAAALEHAFPADVATLAFGPDRPFPADTALRTVRREPGARLQAVIAPRWRLTDEIALEGTYTLLAQRRTHYTGPEGESFPAPPLEWAAGGSAHAAGAGLRYSTLQAYGRDPGVFPYEVTLGISTAFAGAGLAPRATSIRVTGRLYVDRRRLAALLPSREAAAPAELPPADTLPAPPAADTVPGSSPRR